MKKIIITFALLLTIISTSVYALESSKLSYEEYQEYVFSLVHEMDNIPLDLSFENFMKYGLDKGAMEPLKEGLVSQKDVILKHLPEIENFRFKNENIEAERDELVNTLNNILANIDIITNICDEVIVETSIIKSLSIIGYDGSEAINNLCDEYDKLSNIFE